MYFTGLDIAGFYSTSTQIKPLDIIEECKKCLADNDIKVNEIQILVLE